MTRYTLNTAEFRFAAAALRNSFYDLHSSARILRWWMLQSLPPEDAEGVSEGDLRGGLYSRVVAKIASMAGDQIVQVVRDINCVYAESCASVQTKTVAEGLLSEAQFVSVCDDLRATLFNFARPDVEHILDELVCGLEAKLASPVNFGVDLGNVVKKIEAMPVFNLVQFIKDIDHHYAEGLDRP